MIAGSISVFKQCELAGEGHKAGIVQASVKIGEMKLAEHSPFTAYSWKRS